MFQFIVIREKKEQEEEEGEKADRTEQRTAHISGNGAVEGNGMEDGISG